MNPEIAIVIAIIAISIAFVGWRVWQTLRVARGEKACGGCGCDKAETPPRQQQAAH